MTTTQDQPMLSTGNPYQTDQINQAVAAAMATPVAAAAPAPTVEIKAPEDTAVELMVGLAGIDGIKNDAVVRELNGADEEALAAPSLTRSVSKYLAAIVQRGTVSIGGNQPTKEQLSSLLIGDRERLLFAIRRVTYGPTLELTTRCTHCNAVDEGYVFDLADVPRRDLERVEDGIFGIPVEMPSGKRARIELPKASDQDAILQAEGKNDGELNTMMLTRTLKEIDGQQVLGAGPVRALGIKDRNFLLKQLQDKAPGPRLGDAKRVCGSCEEEFPLNLGLLDIFRG